MRLLIEQLLTKIISRKCIKYHKILIDLKPDTCRLLNIREISDKFARHLIESLTTITIDLQIFCDRGHYFASMYYAESMGMI